MAHNAKGQGLILDNVSAGYHKKIIVDGVSFSVPMWGGDRFCMVVMWGKKGAEAMNDGGCEAR